MNKFLPTSILSEVEVLSVNRKGFTLVELLVVITIIGVLSVAGLTVFTGVQKNARDARRKADVDAISKTLEAHYTSTSGYPAIDGTWFDAGVTPTDPLGGAYTITVSGFTYEVCADLESDNRAPADTAPKDFCRKQLQ